MMDPPRQAAIAIPPRTAASVIHAIAPRPRRSLLRAAAAIPVAAFVLACVPPAPSAGAAIGASEGPTGARPGGCFASPDAHAAAADTRPAHLPVETFEAAWSLINQRHFDTTFNGVDWLAVRAELLPRARQARTTDELRRVIRDMLGRLEQSHFALIPAEMAGTFEGETASEESGEIVGGSRGLAESTARRGVDDARDGGSTADEESARPGTVGIELRLSDGQFLVSRVDSASPAARAGVRAGWIVRSVGGCLLAEQLAVIPADAGKRKAAFRATLLAAARLEGRAGTTVSVEFIDGDDRRVGLRLTRAPEPGERVLFGNMPAFYTRFDQERVRAGSSTVGVIRFNTWMTIILPQFDAAIGALRDTDGIIIDLRGNPGGVGALVMGTSGHFLKSRVSLGTLKMRDRDLRYFANPRLVGADGRRVEPFAGPVAVLIDGLTGSTSEVFAGGMQAIGRARVFGETSAGAVLPALNERLPNGDVLYHAFADFVTPAGDRLEGRGVIPDEIVPLDRAALLAGRDNQLDAAIRWIAAEQR